MNPPIRFRSGAICVALVAVLSSAACTSSKTTETTSEAPGKGPLTSFSQEITSPTNEFQVKAGQNYTLDITVKNTGTQPWMSGTGPQSVDAGYRWFDSAGKMLFIEGNRAFLNATVPPGGSESLKLVVVAPSTPGQYTLSISMVQEGIAWFFNQGATPLKISVNVT